MEFWAKYESTRVSSASSKTVQSIAKNPVASIEIT